MPNKSKIIYYIDGLNLYFGLKKRDWDECNWLDIVKLCESNLPKDCDCDTLTVKYYTAKFEAHSAQGKAQDHFLQANEFIHKNTGKLHIIKGVHKDGSSWCDICQTDTPKKNEKKTDVNIAIDMLEDAVINPICDISVLVSNDTDLLPSIEAINRNKPNHRIVIFVPPTDKTNMDLQHSTKKDGQDNVISFHPHINRPYLSCQLPEQIVINPKFTAIRPNIYNRTWLTEEKERKKEEENAALKAAKAAHKAGSSLTSSSEALEALKNKFGSK